MLRENKIDLVSLRIPACASGVVELWFAVADFPKGALGADVVTKAALLALLLDLQFAVWEKRHRDFAVTKSFRHEHSDIVLDRRFARRVAEVRHWLSSRFELVDERQLDFQFAVSEREDSYFTIAFSVAIRAGCFGRGDAAFAEGVDG